MAPILVKINKVTQIKNFPLPEYKTLGSSGMDLHAALSSEVIIGPGKVEAIPSGIKIEIPAGFEAQVRSRSGLAKNHAVAVLNSPGTIDSDFRGEINILLINHGESNFIVRPLDRVAQIVFAAVARAEWVEDSLSKTLRGEGGFGSTGVNGRKET